MKKIKVLQMPIANAGGGITHYVLQNWRFIDRSRFHFDFVTMEKKLDFADELLSQGCSINYLSERPQANRELFTEEISKILDAGYDAIHLHTSEWTGYLVEEIAIEKRIPIIIVHSHNSGVTKADADGKYERILRDHYRLRDEFHEGLATHFFACSSRAADWLFGEQIPREKIQIMKNAIDVKQFDYEPSSRMRLRNTLGLDIYTVFGHVGRFVYQKNHEFLLRLFSKISKDIENARLLLVGDGILTDDMRRLARELGIDRKVLFLGRRNDVHELMQAMDAFLLPSHFEGLPIVLVEAQTSGLRCYVSRNVTTEVGLTDNIEFLPLDIGVWSNRIVSDFTEPQPRCGYAKEVADAGYSIQKQILQLEAVYSEGRSRE